MSTHAGGSLRLRNNPFTRDSLSPSASMSVSGGRPKSMAFTSPPPTSGSLGHSRNQSFSPLSGSTLAPPRTRARSNSNRSTVQSSNTFAPQFIKTEESQRDAERVRAIEGENDFSGKRYVWVKDPQAAFVKAWVVEELAGNRLLVQCDDDTVRVHPRSRETFGLIRDILATRSRCRHSGQSKSG